MSLNGALQIGRSALVASQTGIQVAGNNMANAATEGYTRRLVQLAPLQGEPLGRGQYVGRGVQVESIYRAVDTALQSRHRDALSREHEALIGQRFLTSIEALQNELSDNDISSLLSQFFNSFSELANTPEDRAIRSVVIEQGRNLASRIATLAGEYETVRRQVDGSLDAAVGKANELLDEITLVNRQIAETEAGVGQENALRDRRDQLVDELATLVDVSVVEQPNGAVDVLVGSIPVVLGGQSRGLELRTDPVGDGTELSVRVSADGSELTIASGQIGALLAQREGTVDGAVQALDDLAGELIHQVNRLHAQGQGQSGFDTITGTTAIGDTTANLNAEAAGLDRRIEGGSFFIHVTHAGSGTRTAHQINVDGDAMSLDDLIAQIDAAVPNVTASAGLGNRLSLDAADGFEISFSDDSAGALAVLGVNTFFTGSDATDIDVNELLIDDPGRLAAGRGHVAGSNGTALAIAALQDEQLETLDGGSLRELWQNAVSDHAVRTNAARNAADSAALVRESLSAQMQAVSGVSLDEEAISLLTFQRQFQAAARFISVIDETLQTLLSIA